MGRRFVTVIALLGLSSQAIASTAVEPVLRSADSLLAAEARGFAGLKATEVKALRKNFSDRLAAAKVAAKAEYSQVAGGRTAEEIDKLLWARSMRAGLPAEVKSHVEGAGGPARTMQQMDRITAEFAANVLEGSRQYAQTIFERALDGMLGVAHARLMKRYCYLSVYALTVGAGSPANYDACRRDR